MSVKLSSVCYMQIMRVIRKGFKFNLCMKVFVCIFKINSTLIQRTLIDEIFI